jgi:hypothetical protein
MAKTFIDIFLAANRKIPRRIERFEGSFHMIDSRSVARPHFVEPQFITTEIMKVPLPEANREKPYDFEIGRGRYKNRRMSKDEAALVLGHDFRLVSEEEEIPLMLQACKAETPINAYYLGKRSIEQEGTMRYAQAPVAYFHIHPLDHAAVAIDVKDKRFATLIGKLQLGL